jgi:5-methylcytosine-specific restriction endonuclease McrA
MQKISKCKWCALEFLSANTGAPKLWCSSKCAHLGNKQKRGGTIFGNCNICGSQFLYGKKKLYCSAECSKLGNLIKSREHYRTVTALLEKPATRMKTCGWCNTDMEVPFSYTGTRAYHEHCRVQALRRRNKNKSNKRQNARTDVQIRFDEIAKRDLGVCHICREDVNLSLPRTSRMGATLDHVVPIAKGGLDSVDNVRLAHWICNIRKGDKLEFVNG